MKRAGGVLLAIVGILFAYKMVTFEIEAIKVAQAMETGGK
jgi:hypothetical protein